MTSIEWAGEHVNSEVRREIERLREQYTGRQEPPEPYRMVTSAGLHRLLESIREQISQDSY